MVLLIACDGSAGQVANATMRAAQHGLSAAANDPALIESIWLLTQLPLDARHEEFAAALRHTGLDVTEKPSLFEIVAAVTECIDVRISKQLGRTDLGEIAQMAATETITSVINRRMEGKLFEASAEDVRHAFSELATPTQFSHFAREFFSRLTTKCLGYFVSRTLTNQIGEGHRFTTLAQENDFSEALQRHCYEASRIVEDFSGEWFSKTKWEKGGISKQDVIGFSHVAMRKIGDELRAGAGPRGK